jgi:hypothetical protein
MLELNRCGIREIAETVSVPVSAVENIKKRKSFVYISNKYNIDNHTKRSRPVITTKSKSVKISKDTAVKICELLQNTFKSVKEISTELNVTECKVRAIYYGNAWRSVSKDYKFKKRR